MVEHRQGIRDRHFRTLLWLVALYAVLVVLAVFHTAVRAEDIIPTRNEDEVVVRLLLGTRIHVKSECERLGVKFQSEGGCAITYTDTTPKLCVVWATLPESTEDHERLEILGHELLHCFKGRYHVSH